MKKLAILIMTGVIIATGYTYVYGSPFKVIDKQEAKQLEQYQDEQARNKELSKLHNPLIVQNQLNKVGKIISLEGQMQYVTKIQDKGIMDMTLREMTLDMWWGYGIGIDTQYIKVKEIYNDGTVLLQIPKSMIQLMYVQLNQDSKIIDGKKMIFVNQFKPSEVQITIEQSQQNVANKISKDQGLYDMAYDNLKVQLEEFVKSLGLKGINVEAY